MNLSIYLMLTAVLFAGSIFGILLNSKNLIMLLICVELMFIAINTNFVLFSNLWCDIHGQVFVLFVLTLSAVEIAIGLAIIFSVFQKNKSINVVDLANLRY